MTKVDMQLDQYKLIQSGSAVQSMAEMPCFASNVSTQDLDLPRANKKLSQKGSSLHFGSIMMSDTSELSTGRSKATQPKSKHGGAEKENKDTGLEVLVSVKSRKLLKTQRISPPVRMTPIVLRKEQVVKVPA